MNPKADFIWMDGKMVPWDKATVHVMTHTLHYGLGAFEGIRAYKLTDGRSGVFRLREHIDRLFMSCKFVGITVPYTPEEIETACLETLAVNRLEDGYVRPLVYIGDGAMGLFAIDNPIHVIVATWKWGAYLGDEGLINGIRVKTSSFVRNHPNSMLAKGKICGHYVNSVLAKREAMRDGYKEAILLDTDGYVSEASGENIFLVTKNVLQTPEMAAPILAGVTRDSVLTLAKEMGLAVVEQRFPRDLMYMADEIFLTGTAAEVTPVSEVDGRKVGLGRRGPVCEAIQTRYFAAVRGEDANHRDWVTVYEPERL
ncbi:MAG: branched-chain amino acid transaminase [Myxococcales bacterium]|nr:branched-chain amino acid transaminase [Myxococcales bacterium]